MFTTLLMRMVYALTITSLLGPNPTHSLALEAECADSGGPENTLFTSAGTFWVWAYLDVVAGEVNSTKQCSAIVQATIMLR